MEFLTIFLSSLITLISPAGFVVDRVAESSIRSQFAAVEQLQVRVDNAPSYQIVQGKVERVRIAGRGIFLVQDIRLEALELETDPIQLNSQRVRRGKVELVEPLRTGIRVVVKPEDINQALRSPLVTNQLRSFGASQLRDRETRRRVQRYELLNPRVEFLSNQRIRLEAELKEPDDPTILKVFVESGLQVVAGRQLQLVQPIIRLNGEAVPDEVLETIADGIYQQSDLRQFDPSGITARLLQFNIQPQQLDLAAFVQLAPGKSL